ncbi:MAG: hypothetical protein JWQ26_2043 [Modestobacter sp.]|nr:hypothetical protein [Modestobacter sp.]
MVGPASTNRSAPWGHRSRPQPVEPEHVLAVAAAVGQGAQQQPLRRVGIDHRSQLQDDGPAAEHRAAQPEVHPRPGHRDALDVQAVVLAGDGQERREVLVVGQQLSQVGPVRTEHRGQVRRAVQHDLGTSVGRPSTSATGMRTSTCRLAWPVTRDSRRSAFSPSCRALIWRRRRLCEPTAHRKAPSRARPPMSASSSASAPGSRPGCRTRGVRPGRRRAAARSSRSRRRRPSAPVRRCGPPRGWCGCRPPAPRARGAAAPCAPRSRARRGTVRAQGRPVARAGQSPTVGR